MRGLRSRLARRHREALQESYRQVLDNKLSNLLTVAMLTIGLLLPSLLLHVTRGLEGLLETLQSDAGVSAYLHTTSTEQNLQSLVEEVLARFPGSEVTAQSAEQARSRFAAQTGLSGLLERLPDNPIPPTLHVRPQALDQFSYVSAYLQDSDHVASVSADFRWLSRLQTAVRLLDQASWLLGGLVAIGVVILVAGSIAASIDRQGERIQVMKLVGATDSHVLRPFLYKGLGYGLAAASLTFVVLLALQLLLGPFTAELREQFSLPPGSGWPAATWLLGLCTVGGLLGWGAALAAGWRRIRRHDPGRAIDLAGS